MNAAMAEIIGKTEDFVSYDAKRRSNVFKGTNVPVAYLWDDLMNGDTIFDFMSRNPEIRKEYVLGVVRIASSKVDGL